MGREGGGRGLCCAVLCGNRDCDVVGVGGGSSDWDFLDGKEGKEVLLLFFKREGGG